MSFFFAEKKKGESSKKTISKAHPFLLKLIEKGHAETTGLVGTS